MTFDLAWYLTNGQRISDECYRANDMLRRDPDPVGLYNWLYHLREEGWTVEQVKAAIQKSDEWHAIHDTPPTPKRLPLPPFPPGSYDRDLPWVPPKTRDFIRADAWGVPVPGLPFVAGGSSEHPERLLTPFLYKYPRSLWSACFGAHKDRGYTHWVLWWPNARADGMSPADFAAMCGEIQAIGFYTQVGLNSKDFDPRDQSPQQWKASLEPLFDALTARGAADEYAVWEWDSHNVPGQPTIETLKYMGRRAHAAGASFWLHFYPEHTSWFADGDPRGRYGFYDDLGADVNGLQYQTVPTWDIPMTQARIVDTLTQFGTQRWGHKFRFFEDQATLQFTHDHPDEDDANLRGYLACCTKGLAPVWGYGNGARRPNGDVL